MSDFDHDANDPRCFSPQNPDVDTTRVVFDVSNIPVGELQPLQPPDGEITPTTEEFLRRTLFPELSPLLPPFQEADPSTAPTIGNETNLVTMTTATLPSRAPEPMEEEQEMAAPRPVVRPRPRQRFRYAGKCFYATSDLYLQLDPSSPPPEATPELVGVVAKCPTEKNGQQYTIRWKYPRLHGLQWPANLKNHLKTTFDKDFLHPGLKGWITSCPLNSTDHNPAGTIAAQQQATTTPLARRPNHANDPPPPPLPEINVLVAENTPAPSQRMAFAAVHTAGSTSLYSAGAISSLGHSNRSRYTRTLEGTILAIDEQDITSPPVPVAATPPPPLPPMTSRTTRTRANTRTVGAASQRARAAGRYDSDDDNTDGEAEYQMDPHDGFWNPSIEEENILRLLRTQELNLFEDDDDGLSTTEDNPVFGTSTVRPAVSDLGTLIQNCTDFQFEELGMDALAAETLLTPPQPLYVGESGLRRGVAGSFSTPLEAFRKAGFTPDLISRYTQNSNKYFHEVIKPNIDNTNTSSRVWQGILWKDITEAEMYRFIGFLLRSSLQPVDSGGYAAYFTGTNLKVDVNKEHTVEIPGTSGFMADLPEKYRMTMNRFKQIRGAYHPEDRELGNSTDDKCYQLRYTINELNAASAANFIPEGNLSFDEGGIRCRSRFCPVRMYNKDKPDKFRVDFFILAGSDSYIIHHLDVYQGKNACNVSVDESCWNLPTTMKAVVNAVIKCQLKNGSNDVNGYRVISLDNRYQCPQLAYLLWTRFRILTTGTCRTNRKGWPKDIMTLLKTAGRGVYKIAICRQYNLMAVQWCDSRVVNQVSSYMNFGIGQVRRRVGQERRTVDCPQVVMHYQQNMGGVDRGDQKRDHFGAFAAKAHFKKWYKKTVMALLDCMMMNAIIMWNMSLESDAAKAMGRKKMERWEFMQVLAYELQTYETPSLKSPPQQSRTDEAIAMDTEAHTNTAGVNGAGVNRVLSLEDKSGRRCVVCQVEEPIIKACIQEYTEANPNEVAGSDGPKVFAALTRGNRGKLSACGCCNQHQGGLSAHNFVMSPQEQKQIHTLFPSEMTCMEIVHSDVGKELWKRKAGDSTKKRMRVSTKHYYMKELKELIRGKVATAFTSSNVT